MNSIKSLFNQIDFVLISFVYRIIYQKRIELFINFYFIQCEAWEKVMESVSRQARLQRILKQRLRNLWTQLKSHIVVFN